MLNASTFVERVGPRLGTDSSTFAGACFVDPGFTNFVTRQKGIFSTRPEDILDLGAVTVGDALSITLLIKNNVLPVDFTSGSDPGDPGVAWRAEGTVVLTQSTCGACGSWDIINATLQVDIVVDEEELDHFAVTAAPNTLNSGEAAVLTVQAQDANDQDIDPGAIDVQFSFDDAAAGRILWNGAEIGPSTNVPYADANSGAVTFVAGTPPPLPARLGEVPEPVSVAGKANADPIEKTVAITVVKADDANIQGATTLTVFLQPLEFMLDIGSPLECVTSAPVNISWEGDEPGEDFDLQLSLTGGDVIYGDVKADPGAKGDLVTFSFEALKGGQVDVSFTIDGEVVVVFDEEVTLLLTVPPVGDQPGSSTQATTLLKANTVCSVIPNPTIDLTTERQDDGFGCGAAETGLFGFSDAKALLGLTTTAQGCYDGDLNQWQVQLGEVSLLPSTKIRYGICPGTAAGLDRIEISGADDADITQENFLEVISDLKKRLQWYKDKRPQKPDGSAQTTDRNPFVYWPSIETLGHELEHVATYQSELQNLIQNGIGFDAVASTLTIPRNQAPCASVLEDFFKDQLQKAGEELRNELQKKLDALRANRDNDRAGELEFRAYEESKRVLEALIQDIATRFGQ